MDVEYILYEVLIYRPYQGWSYPQRYKDYKEALSEFETRTEYVSKKEFDLYLEGIDETGNSTTLKEY